MFLSSILDNQNQVFNSVVIRKKEFTIWRWAYKPKHAFESELNNKMKSEIVVCNVDWINYTILGKSHNLVLYNVKNSRSSGCDVGSDFRVNYIGYSSYVRTKTHFKFCKHRTTSQIIFVWICSVMFFKWSVHITGDSLLKLLRQSACMHVTSPERPNGFSLNLILRWCQYVLFFMSIGEFQKTYNTCLK